MQKIEHTSKNSSLSEQSTIFTSSFGAGVARAYKFGKIVLLTYEITLSKEVRPWEDTLLKIPQGYIPIVSLYVPNIGSYNAYIYGAESGVIVLSGSGGKKGEVIIGTVAYIVE